MKLNYLKTLVTTTIVASAFSFALPTMAVAPVSVIPAESEKQESLKDFQLVFAADAVAEWTVTGTENTPKLYKDGAAEAVGLAGPSMLSADGNKLNINWPNEFTRAGKYELTIPAGAYSVNNEANEACKFAWDVTGIQLGYSISPDVNMVTEIQNIRITFNDNDIVEMGNEWGTNFGAVLYIVNDENDKAANRRGTFMPQFVGNSVLLTMNTPITEAGDYVIEIPADAFKLDGNLYEEAITLNYTIAESFDPFQFTVTPAAGTVDKLSSIEITFVDATEAVWNIDAIQNNRELCPRIQSGEDITENLTGLTEEGNVLIAGPYDPTFEWTVGGNYIVTIPAGSYSVDGKEGVDIVLNYVVSGTVGVDAILGSAKTVTVYDLNGNVLLKNADANALKQLRGIFVVNGKKYIIR